MTAPDIDPMAIAEVVNKHGDPDAFAERDLVLLQSIQALPIGTQLFAVYPLQADDPEPWAAIRETLQDLALTGAQAELDEVDARLLLGLMDSDPYRRLVQELRARMATVQTAGDVLRNALATTHAHALQLIHAAATAPDRLDRIDDIARVARCVLPSTPQEARNSADLLGRFVQGQRLGQPSTPPPETPPT